MNEASLLLIILLPMAGGLAAWGLARWSEAAARWVALAALGVGLGVAAAAGLTAPAGPDGWISRVSTSWIPRFGIGLDLGLDGLSLAMVLLTYFLGLVSVLASWTGINERVGFFYLNLLWVLAGVNGVFLALDLFLFAFFFLCIFILLLTHSLNLSHNRAVISTSLMNSGKSHKENHYFDTSQNHKQHEHPFQVQR